MESGPRIGEHMNNTFASDSKQRAESAAKPFRAAELGGPIPERPNGSRRLLEQLCAPKNLTPCSLFSSSKDVRNEMLFEFCQKSQEAGFSPTEVAWTIFNGRYPAKLENYQDTSANQAAGEIVLAGTAKVNWFDILEGNSPIIENGTLLNGTFGRKLTCKELEAQNVWNEIADTLYLTKHDQHANLPQTPWIMFAEKTRGEAEYAEKANAALSHRAKFKEELSGVVGNIVGINHLKISDLHHPSFGTTKFRLVSVVFDYENGALWVVSDTPSPNGQLRARQKFADWARESENLRNILSCDAAELEDIRSLAREVGLSEKLARPARKGNEHPYQPWEDLAKEVKSRLIAENGSEEGWYKWANQVWRYCIIERQATNVEHYEEKWQYIRQVEETLCSVMKIACDDGRQAGDVKVLGGMLTHEEFKQLFIGNRPPQELVFAPHYKCGFLGAAYDIHKQFTRLQEVLRIELSNDTSGGANSKYRRSMDFFQDLIQNVLKKIGPLTERNNLYDYLSPVLQKEFKAYLEEFDRNNAGYGHGDRNRELVEFLFKVFVYNEETYREVMRRGARAGVFEATPEGLLRMPAVEFTEARIRTYLSDEEAPKITEEHKKALVIEQVARYKLKKYSEWIGELPEEKRVKIVAYLDNFQTGQATQIPPKPASAEELLNRTRYDFVLNNSEVYGPEEVAAMGLSGMMTWQLPQ